MLVKLLEALILVVLSGDVGAQFAEFLELLFALLCWGLNERLDALQVFVMVHLGTRVANDLDIAREELVAIL